jgi:nucleoside-diphosphate-sugar epimerase
MKKTILVTGCSGFLGSHLVKYFKNNNYKIIGIDLKKTLFKSYNFFFYKCSLLNINKMRTIIKNNNPDIIIHLAATTKLDLKDLNSYKSNHIGTKNLIRIINEGKKEIKFISMSTMLVNHMDLTSLIGYEPTTPYGKSKTIIEKFLRTSPNQNFSWCLLRPITIWGDELDNHFRTFLFLVEKKLYFCIKNQKTYKSFSYVKNAVFQIVKIINKNSVNFNRKIFYLADYEPVELNSWADKIFELFHGNNKKNNRISIKLLKLLSLLGDLFVKLGFYNFYIQSRRLNNMTASFVIKHNKLEKLTGKLPHKIDQATKNFIDSYKRSTNK